MWPYLRKLMIMIWFEHCNHLGAPRIDDTARAKDDCIHHTGKFATLTPNVQTPLGMKNATGRTITYKKLSFFRCKRSLCFSIIYHNHSVVIILQH